MVFNSKNTQGVSDGSRNMGERLYDLAEVTWGGPVRLQTGFPKTLPDFPHCPSIDNWSHES